MNLYEKLATDLERQIQKGTFNYGDRLPSVRSIHQETGMSISTVLQSMYLLESKGLIEARPKKGYFVRPYPRADHSKPVISKPIARKGKRDIEDFIQKVYGPMNSEKSLTNFSVGVPSPEMLPIAKLKKIVRDMMRDLPDACIHYEPIMGSEYLRRQVAKRTLLWQNSLSTDDLVTTNGCMNSLAYALMSLTQKGDSIITESPVYFGTLQLAKSLGLSVIEMPTHSEYGLELEAVEKTVKENKISAIIVVSNFSNPMGYCMPDEHKRRLVHICTENQVPLLEEDLYGDVFFGAERPLSCKSIDQEGIVLWCNSVSKTLAPGYRVGWIAPGKFKDKICKTKLYHNVASSSLTHEVIARFMDKGRYENHLRQLRISLQHNLLKSLQTIHEHFPENTKVTYPNGGFLLWLELDPKIDTTVLYEQALKKGIKYAPGRMFTLRDQFKNCLRLSYGLSWNEQIRQSLIHLGELLKRQLV
ncbi:PLP-dependent aminotransferase family protein [Echinicola sediminis]